MTILEQVLAGEAPAIVPLTVDQYHQMIARGILREGEPIELIDGMLIRKDRSDSGGSPMSHGPRHRSAIVALQEEIGDVRASGCHLSIQLPVTLAATQEPEPDVAIVRGRHQQYTSRHPAPADIVALMEVADSSLTFDRTTKLRLYATAGIEIYWIVNLVDQQIEVYEKPQPEAGTYSSRTDHPMGQSVRLMLSAEAAIEVRVADILPPEVA